MRTIGTFAVGLALVSGTSLAQAQIAVSRQITSEPVYARYSDQVYLVDPATGIIVADITQ
jgi:hypothetical protein